MIHSWENKLWTHSNKTSKKKPSNLVKAKIFEFFTNFKLTPSLLMEQWMGKAEDKEVARMWMQGEENH